MSDKVKGYVVRWTEYDAVGVPSAAAATAASLAEAMQVWDDLGAMGQAIFSVAEDGTETPLPTYEEALVERDAARMALTAFSIPDDGWTMLRRVEVLGERGARMEDALRRLCGGFRLKFCPSNFDRLVVEASSARQLRDEAMALRDEVLAALEEARTRIAKLEERLALAQRRDPLIEGIARSELGRE